MHRGVTSLTHTNSIQSTVKHSYVCVQPPIGTHMRRLELHYEYLLPTVTIGHRSHYHGNRHIFGVSNLVHCQCLQAKKGFPCLFVFSCWPLTFVLHEELCRVGEAGGGVQSLSTVGMLSSLLHIKHWCYTSPVGPRCRGVRGVCGSQWELSEVRGDERWRELWAFGGGWERGVWGVSAVRWGAEGRKRSGKCRKASTLA